MSARVRMPAKKLLGLRNNTATFCLCCVVTFRASCLSGVALGRGVLMARRKETTIERIFREVTGRKMSQAIKRILLTEAER